MSSPKSTPFLDRMRQSLGGSGSGAGSPTASKGSATGGGTSTSPVARAASAAVLRRRDREARNALTFAANTLTKVVDTVEQAAKKVSFGSIATAVASITRDKKGTQASVAQPGPEGVTRACSVIFTHVLSPLWSVERKAMVVPRNPVSFASADAVRLMKDMDAGNDGPNMLEVFLSQERRDVDLATAFVILLCAKLRWLEGQEPLVLKDPLSDSQPARESVVRQIVNPTYEQLYLALREEFLSRDDTDTRFEDRPNDEVQTADHARRKLDRVGGALWKPKGASLLRATEHDHRQRLLSTLLYASVCLEYNYYDPLLQFVVDEIACKLLFLTSFSEGFTLLVAGTKGPNYVAKYLLFLCRDVAKDSLASTTATASPAADLTGAAERTAHHCLPAAAVDSSAMQEVHTALELAFANFVHRNDVNHVLFQACHLAVKQLSQDDTISCSALFLRISWALRVSYVADLELLVALIDAVKPLVAKPSPVGIEALALLHLLSEAIRNVNSLQRKHLNAMFVGGPEHSFRRVPAYVIASPYSARATLFHHVYWGDIDQRRGANPNLPVVIGAGLDPITRSPLPQFDDSTCCLSNALINVFQTLHELQPPGSVDVSLIDLRLLFSIAPTALASLLPDTLRDLLPVGGLSPNMSEAAVRTLMEVYMTIQDRYRPATGAIRFRNESPRLPVVPVRVHKYFDKDDLELILKSICDDFATSCDARIGDRDVAALHPTHHLSLRVYVDNCFKLLLAGGSGVLRRTITSALRLQQNYPGSFIRPLYFLLPFGYGNDVAAWLARADPVYRERIYNMVLSWQLTALDTPTMEQWSTGISSQDPMGLVRRDAVNDFLTFGAVCNEVVIYQAECQFADPTMGTCYLPFAGNFEVGAHINAAATSALRSGGASPSAFVPQSSIHGSTFSTEKIRSTKSGYFSRQSTALSSSSSDNILRDAASFGPSSAPQLMPSPNSFASSFSVSIGDRFESLDRVLTRMHGGRGIPVSTKRHVVDGSDLHDAASGEDILDWISTSYHIYDVNAAKVTAQSLLDGKLFTTLCVPLGKDPAKFTDSGLYALMPREEPDAQPLCPPATRSWLCEQSNLNRIEYEELLTGGGSAAAPSVQGGMGTGQVPFIRARVTFQSFYENSLQNNDLVDSKEAGTRDLLYVKLKSSGSPDDIGPVPDPCAPTLVMTLLEQETKRRGGASAVAAGGSRRDLGDLLSHYQIKYGEKSYVDHRSVLQLEWKPLTSGGGSGSETNPLSPFQERERTNTSFGTMPSSGGLTKTSVNAADTVGMYCMCDGDVFGPFCNIRVKPVLVRMTSEPNRATFATASVMSFVKPR